MKYYLIAGEASGDMHAANLMKGIQEIDSEAAFRFFGGDKMQGVHPGLVKHYKEMAFMGLFDVLANIRTLVSYIKYCRQDVKNYNPDVLILVDYAGFNLKIARFAKSEGIKVFYYITPKVWAWQESRVKKLKAYTDKLFVIFPFEVDYFRSHQLDVVFEGNPTIDALQPYIDLEPDHHNFRHHLGLDERPIVALLAGSRKHEVKRLLPEMLEASKKFPDYQFVVAGAESLQEEIYAPMLKDTQVKLVKNKTYELLRHAVAAIVTSGTATLETALLNVPQVVVFKTGDITYAIGKLVVDVKFFSLVNISLDKEVVKELLQHNLTRDIITELKEILENSAYRHRMLQNYAQLQQQYGKSGASERVARTMIALLKSGAEKGKSDD